MGIWPLTLVLCQFVCLYSHAWITELPWQVLIDGYLPPATKFGKGYIFTGVFDSVHGGGGVVSNFSGRGVWSPIFQGGPQFFGGSPNFRGVSKFFFQFLSPQNFFFYAPTPLRRSMRGRYASYWNAFLLTLPSQIWNQFNTIRWCSTILLIFLLHTKFTLNSESVESVIQVWFVWKPKTLTRIQGSVIQANNHHNLNLIPFKITILSCTISHDKTITRFIIFFCMFCLFVGWRPGEV